MNPSPLPGNDIGYIRKASGSAPWQNCDPGPLDIELVATGMAAS
jgi:hypothetical protein